ncbi:PFL_4695 family integrating conjugative element protein [Legionella feeleii]|uniref:Integrating conjugative element protein, PFL_4695 family n=1 Tax=Legionella feeleii TaxID=453 RepID=A0A0W0TH22_9GAMM|nr:integrating conjugative element protein [Legionella feeleii]KTC94858.1 hypothetical protein Lfee_2522 [Legionella feeleii]SPX62058.1 integrating conjugative element protein, PFL_4695 family [Legionella feeleii]
MRTLFFFITWLFIATCYALKVIALESPVIDAAPYLGAGPIQSTRDGIKPRPQAFPLPVVSRIKPGVVGRHAINNSRLSHVLFVVGDDLGSRAWLKAHAALLQKKKALGFVTNVATSEALHELTQLAGLPLQPVDVDELAALLAVHHYPFAYDSGVVWQ